MFTFRKDIFALFASRIRASFSCTSRSLEAIASFSETGRSLRPFDAAPSVNRSRRCLNALSLQELQFEISPFFAQNVPLNYVFRSINLNRVLYSEHLHQSDIH